MRHIQPLLLPQPCQSQAHRDNDRMVSNPCFLSPQTVHIHVRILNLFYRALLCHFIAYHHAKKTPIHLLAAGLTLSIRSLPLRQENAHTSSCRRSNYEWIRSDLLKSKDHACPLVYHRVQLDKARPQGTACHPESLSAGLKSNNHACPLVSRSVTGLYTLGSTKYI